MIGTKVMYTLDILPEPTKIGRGTRLIFIIVVVQSYLVLAATIENIYLTKYHLFREWFSISKTVHGGDLGLLKLEGSADRFTPVCLPKPHQSGSFISWTGSVNGEFIIILSCSGKPTLSQKS